MRTRTPTLLMAPLLVAALGFATLTACSDDGDAAPAGVEVPVDPVSVTLVDRGQEPVAPLVWFSDPGDQEVTYRATQGLGQRVEGAPGPAQAGDTVPQKDVTMELPLTATASTDGETRTTTVTAGTPTGDNAARNDDIATASGFRVTTRTQQNGRTTSRTLAAPEGATDSARASVEESLRQMADVPLVFPDEGVGPGARWKVSSHIGGDTPMNQDVSYTLISRDGPHVALAVDVDRECDMGAVAGDEGVADVLVHRRVTADVAADLPPCPGADALVGKDERHVGHLPEGLLDAGPRAVRRPLRRGERPRGRPPVLLRPGRHPEPGGRRDVVVARRVVPGGRARGDGRRAGLPVGRGRGGERQLHRHVLLRDRVACLGGARGALDALAEALGRPVGHLLVAGVAEPDEGGDGLLPPVDEGHRHGVDGDLDAGRRGVAVVGTRGEGGESEGGDEQRGHEEGRGSGTHSRQVTNDRGVGR
ncbi:hypothetical protein MTQ16_08395 [Corynebacterium bovis]|uniref:hypothetical protein n=1 Tax=Corynebacterium bovis TaxID=36808 RepID=UPI00313969C3